MSRKVAVFSFRAVIMLYVDYQNNDKKVARVYYNMILMMDELRKYAFTFTSISAG